MHLHGCEMLVLTSWKIITDESNVLCDGVRLDYCTPDSDSISNLNLFLLGYPTKTWLLACTQHERDALVLFLQVWEDAHAAQGKGRRLESDARGSLHELLDLHSCMCISFFCPIIKIACIHQIKHEFSLFQLSTVSMTPNISKIL